jgi:hypothetical protein
VLVAAPHVGPFILGQNKKRAATRAAPTGNVPPFQPSPRLWLTSQGGGQKGDGDCFESLPHSDFFWIFAQTAWMAFRKGTDSPQ